MKIGFSQYVELGFYAVFALANLSPLIGYGIGALIDHVKSKRNRPRKGGGLLI